MNKKEIKELLIVLNSTHNFLDKYPIGNKKLMEKVKVLEINNKIKYNNIANKWEIV